MRESSGTGIWRRLTAGKEIGKVAEELGGEAAQARLLSEAGYANQAAGFCARLAAELARALPLAIDNQTVRFFARFFPAAKVMAVARREATYRWPAKTPGAGTPASQVSLTPEETAELWPWLSGQMTVRLARAHALTADTELALAALGALEEFCLHNPPLMGPGWYEPPLLAVRALNWLWALRFLGSTLGLKPEVVLKATVHLRVMALVLGQHLKDAGPDLRPRDAGPAAALLFLGRTLNFLPEAGHWLSSGTQGLAPALSTWSKTGLNIPLASPAEAAAAAEWGGLGLWLGLRSEIKLPGLGAALGKLAWLCRAAAPPWGAGLGWGWTPLCPVTGLDSARLDPYTSPANLAAMLLNQPDLRAGRVLDEPLFWLFGPLAAEKLRLLAGGAPPGGKDLPGAGITLLCAEMNGRKISVAMRSAPRFRKKNPQLDAQALSLVVCLDGKGLLIPPGPAGTGPLSRHLSGRSAFNAVMVDQAEPAQGKVSLESLEVSPRHMFAAASYDGYQYLTDPVHLRRRVFLDLAGGLVDIVDQVQGQGEHACEVFYHLPPETQVSPGEGGTLLLSGNFGRVLMRPEPKAQVEVIKGAENPPQGWVATGIGQVRPAPVLAMRAKVRGNARLTTVIALGKG